jgi:L-seryl-tRNA(Ser) seleniumtransferase
MVKLALSRTLDELRAAAARGAEAPAQADILAAALGDLARTESGLREVINATGVILHTNLGRAPLSRLAVRAAATAAGGYSDLELDRATGARGRRTARAELLVRALTGAEDSLVVNNNAAALLLALAALAGRKEVIVSRGELIEIGGEFRLPDIMAASGAKLVEVGTTNRTRVGDYRKALGRRTGLILKVHPSNYRVTGFTNSVGVSELADVARAGGVPLVYDVGSGLLDRYPEVPDDEPAVAEALADGADVVAFSGDKLLGGPQAGILAGRADLVGAMRAHPLARALRVDKMTVAALEAVLRTYARGRRQEVPVWSLLGASPTVLRRRAHALASAFRHASVRESQSVVGGGALPGHSLPSSELVIRVPDPDRVAAQLRLGRPSVVCRIDDGAVTFDLRTVPPENDDRLARAIRYAIEQG